MRDPEALQHIKNYNPDIKLIVTLRDPVTRFMIQQSMQMNWMQMNMKFMNPVELHIKNIQKQCKNM